MESTLNIEIGYRKIDHGFNELCTLVSRAYRTIDWSSLLDYEFVNIKIREFLTKENLEGIREFLRWREYRRD